MLTAMVYAIQNNEHWHVEATILILSALQTKRASL